MTRLTALRLLKLTLWALSCYFLLIFLAHVTGTKLPLLFVYFDVPSTIYQDRIIAFFAFGWAVFIATTARDPGTNLQFVRALIVAATGAIIILSFINLSTDFASYSADIEVWRFWVQTGLLAAIALWLVLLVSFAKK